ncbi:DNA topoisomerase (ATP-hydrolyzing) subunit A [Candidatus Cyanaurora vandensis]|uniref:DNA gyrase/topoisomerase IV subunit A n=1 Tax=Candidatus Cyanaurora vandensis TaxID=2714958 RepID=UPI002579BD98|nr:DNA topoisomerase (ATP-hydrolyzing) [Candidatus Cyanaurora vandensis]
MLPTPGQIVPTSLQGEMQRSYLAYAMSVIVGRALPDVRDGLKPVHRRILFAMHELGLSPDRPFRKCARVVGDVLGKYHPHGDTAVYDALVRLAQDFASRYPLIEGHGNFGSLDNDPPAAMRYTESRLSPVATEGLLQEVGEPSVDFQDNFDGSSQEPEVLPARLPFLLLNGANGIAVGMATNIPPHNLGELVDGLVALIEDPDLTLEQLLNHIPGPDFPTGGEVVGAESIRDAYRTGRGSVTMRGLIELETLPERRTKQALVIRSLPYQVSIEALTVKIAELVNEERILGISDLRNESNRTGVRIVVELKRDANPDQIRNLLYRHTPLQENFGIIQLAIVNGQPQLLPLKSLLQHFLDFRLVTLTRRFEHERTQAEQRIHLLEGSQRVLADLPRAVALLLEAEDGPRALIALRETFGLSAEQGEHILQMPLRRLTRLDRRHLEEELTRWQKQSQELTTLLADRKKLLSYLKKELLALKKKFADPRRTLLHQALPAAPQAVDLISDSPWLIQYNQRGYVRRTAPTRKAPPPDTVQILTGRSFTDLLALTQTGRAYRLKFHAIPEKVRGTPLNTLLNTPDPILTTLALEEYRADQMLLLLSAQGRLKKVALAELANLTGRGLTVMRLAPEDSLVAAVLADAAQVLLATRSGRLFRFANDNIQIPAGGLTSGGVQATQLSKTDGMLGLVPVVPTDEVVLVTQTGRAKRLLVKEVRETARASTVMGTMGFKFSPGDQLAGFMRVQTGREYLALTSSERLLTAPAITRETRTGAGQTVFALNLDERVTGLLTLPELG